MLQGDEGRHASSIGGSSLEIMPRVGWPWCFSLFFLNVVDLFVDQLRHLLFELDELAGLLGQDLVLGLEGAHEEVFDEVLHVLEIPFVVLGAHAFRYLGDEVTVSDYVIGKLLGFVQERKDIIQHSV